MNADSVLLVMDVQNDFLPGGALGVPHGDVVVAPLGVARGVQNKLLEAMAMAVPVIGGTLDRERTMTGAQYLAGQVQRARVRLGEVCAAIREGECRDGGEQRGDDATDRHA